MVMTRQAFLTLMTTGLRKVFFDQYDEQSLVYPKLYTVQSSKQRKEDYQTVAGIGMLSEKAEGTPITYEDMVEGYDQSFTHTSYAKGIRLTRELLDDELYGVMKRRVRALARSARYRKEYDHAKLFNYASTAASSGGFDGADGLALLSTDHTLAAVPGTTWANTPGSTDLSASALETGIIAFKRFVDDQNMLINVEPKYLLVPPELGPDAREYLGERANLKPGTANNDINDLRGRLTVIEWPFITDKDAWFILAGKSEDMGPLSFDRVPVEFENDGDFDTKDLKVSAYTRYSLGFVDPRFCYGSMGSG